MKNQEKGYVHIKQDSIRIKNELKLNTIISINKLFLKTNNTNF